MTPARRFAYRLALALGWSNPDAMLATMPHRIFIEWMEYARLEPFGEERADMRAGIIASTVANSITALINIFSKSKIRRRLKVIDFMPFAHRDEPMVTPPQSQSKRHHNQALAFMQMYGGEIIVRKKGES